jgi:hypothetical protein
MSTERVGEAEVARVEDHLRVDHPRKLATTGRDLAEILKHVRVVEMPEAWSDAYW